MTDLGSHADDRTMLTGFLDWYRWVAENKLEDLTRDDATRVTTPGGLTMLGIVKHLAWVERIWFRRYFAGAEREAIENPQSFELAPDDTTESVLATYRSDCAAAREITESAALDQTSVVAHDVYGLVSFRWILVHMIEETARHSGHLDILRELTDGRTGDF